MHWTPPSLLSIFQDLATRPDAHRRHEYHTDILLFVLDDILVFPRRRSRLAFRNISIASHPPQQTGSSNENYSQVVCVKVACECGLKFRARGLWHESPQSSMKMSTSAQGRIGLRLRVTFSHRELMPVRRTPEHPSWAMKTLVST